MKSRLEVRRFAIESASSLKDVTSDNLISVAKEIEDYVLGGSELPEIYDETTQTMKLAEMFAKVSTPQTPSFQSIFEHQNDKKEDETDK